MKIAIQAILLSCFILFANCTLSYAGKTQGSDCDFTEAMAFIDKYSGNRDVLDKASKCLENMAIDDPLSYLVKGRILFKTGYQKNAQYSADSMQAARKYFEKAIELAPENYEVNYYATLFYVYDDQEKAQTFLKKMSESPLNSERTLYLKMLLLPEGNTEKEKLAHHFSESPVFIQKAMALSILKKIHWETDHDLVEMAYKEIFENCKRHDVNLAWDYLDYAGFLTYQTREFDKAAEMIDVSRSYMKFGMQDTYEAEIVYRKGYQYVWKTNPRDYGKAISLLKESIQLNKNHMFAYYNLAIASYHHGMNTEDKKLIYTAREYLQISREKNPSYGEVEKYMAMIDRTISQIENQ